MHPRFAVLAARLRAGRQQWRCVPRTVRWFTPFAVLALGAFIIFDRQWYTTAPEGNPRFGVNFSCKHADWLGLDCDATLAALLDDLGARLFRLSAYWDEIERAPGVYDWSSIERQLDAIHARGGRAVVTLGMKGQRWPEWWLPAWLQKAADIPYEGFPEDIPLLREHLFPYLDAAARHLAAHPAVEALQVENEPFVHYKGRTNGRHIRREFLAREIATVRAADAAGLPIVVSHASWLRRDMTWSWILDNADVVAQSIYTKRQRGPWPWLYIFPYHFGPWTPFLPGQAREAARRGKELWIGELQAEPFEQASIDPRAVPAYTLKSFSPGRLRDNVAVARRSGATRVYLWGAEWWLYLCVQRGDASLWEAGKALFRSNPPDETRQH